MPSAVGAPSSATTTISGFSAARARSYLVRLPLFTRAIIAVIALFWVLGLQTVWDVRAWGVLAPNEVGFTTR